LDTEAAIRCTVMGIMWGRKGGTDRQNEKAT